MNVLESILHIEDKMGSVKSIIEGLTHLDLDKMNQVINEVESVVKVVGEMKLILGIVS